MSKQRLLATGLLALAGTMAACGSDSSTGPSAMGRTSVDLVADEVPLLSSTALFSATESAPTFPVDSVKSVDVFITRIDARQAEADSATAAKDADKEDNDGWKTVASPNASLDLLSLRGGRTANLGQKSLPAGSYKAFRLILDASKSSVTLKNGTVLKNNTTPGVTFPSASTSGIKINLDGGGSFTVGKDSTSTLKVDFDVAKSFVVRGNSIAQNGLIFKPVIRASVKK